MLIVQHTVLLVPARNGAICIPSHFTIIGQTRLHYDRWHHFIGTNHPCIFFYPPLPTFSNIFPLPTMVWKHILSGRLRVSLPVREYLQESRINYLPHDETLVQSEKICRQQRLVTWNDRNCLWKSKKLWGEKEKLLVTTMFSKGLISQARKKMAYALKPNLFLAFEFNTVLADLSVITAVKTSWLTVHHRRYPCFHKVVLSQVPGKPIITFSYILDMRGQIWQRKFVSS